MDAQDLLEKVANVVDAHVSNVNYNSASAAVSLCADEVELFCVCLQRLAVVCCALSLRLYNLGVLEADKLHTRFTSLRTGVYNDASSAAVRNEALSFFAFVIPVDTAGKYTNLLLSWLKEVVRNSGNYSLAALNSVVTAVLPLLKSNPEAACKVIRTLIAHIRLELHFKSIHRLVSTPTSSSFWIACALAPPPRMPAPTPGLRRERAAYSRRTTALT